MHLAHDMALLRLSGFSVTKEDTYGTSYLFSHSTFWKKYKAGELILFQLNILGDYITLLNVVIFYYFNILGVKICIISQFSLLF